MPRPAEPPRLYLRKDKGGGKVWIIRDRNRDRRTGCAERDLKGAEERLAEYLAEKHEAKPVIGGRSDTVSIAEVMRVYAIEHAPTTARPALIEEHLQGLKSFWALKPVSAIKGSTCREFARTKRPSMARRQLETLRAAVNYFHREYGLDPVPAFTMPAKHRPRERWLTRSEAAALLASAMGIVATAYDVASRKPVQWNRMHKPQPHLARFILIGLYTGTRSAAILGLSWLPATHTGWVDIEAGVIHRSGRDQRQTKKRQPPVAIPDRLMPHLRRWKQADGNVRHVIHWNGSTVQSIKKAFRSARKNASVSNDVVPHTLRHTAATWLMQAGVDIWKAAGFLGMTAEMVERTYGHQHPHYQKEAANAL